MRGLRTYYYNNSSNFGGVSALAQGFVNKSFLTDQNWNVSRIVAPMDISSLTGNITEIALRFIADSQAIQNLELKDALPGSETNKPDVLDKDGYSLDNYGGDSWVWIENPGGPDYRSKISNRAGLQAILRRSRLSRSSPT